MLACIPTLLANPRGLHGLAPTSRTDKLGTSEPAGLSHMQSWKPNLGASTTPAVAEHLTVAPADHCSCFQTQLMTFPLFSKNL